MTIRTASQRTIRELPRGRAHGFSVLELLVASGLLAVIMVGLLSMFYQTEKAFQIGVVQADTLEGGRSAMELISRDLLELSPTWDTNAVHFYVDIGTYGADMELGTGEYRTNVLQPFYLIRRINDEWRGVRYDFLQEDKDSHVARLWRFEYRLPATNALEMALLLGKNDIDTTPDGYGLIVDGVVNLTLRSFDGAGNVITNFPYSFGGPYFTYSFYGTNVPAEVEVELGILEPKALDTWRNLTPANQGRFLAESAPKVYLFRERIPVRSTR